MHELDKFTIDHEPISSYNLMERAAQAMTAYITTVWHTDTPVYVMAGPGNNGGDALAIARMMARQGYQTHAYLFNIGGKLSADCEANRRLLADSGLPVTLTEVTSEFDPPALGRGMLVIDGLFGSGLNRPLAGGFASLVKYVNASQADVVSIDVPSGLMAEDNSANVRANIMEACLTLTLQHPKLAFVFDDNHSLLSSRKGSGRAAGYIAEEDRRLGRVVTVDIGLANPGDANICAHYGLIEREDAARLLMPRPYNAHKGTMGTALVIAGSYGMAGAAVLAAKACMRAGAGKTILHTPQRNVMAAQISVPEAIVSIDKDNDRFTQYVDMQGVKALGIGPGLGRDDKTAVALITQLGKATVPMVIDADALNLLASHRTWLQQLPQGAILTPHATELDRLAGHECRDGYERLCHAQNLAESIRGYVVLKGHTTAVCMPNGNVVFNTTGNAGMATAGSGDVLTGLLTGLLARGYSAESASVLGVYLHGLAGDLAAQEFGMESLTAGDIIQYVPAAFRLLESVEP